MVKKKRKIKFKYADFVTNILLENKDVDFVYKLLTVLVAAYRRTCGPYRG